MTAGKLVMAQYNRILIPSRAQFMNVYRAKEGQVVIDMRLEPVAMQLLLQEFISVGNVELAIEPGHTMYEQVEELPSNLRKLVKRIDNNLISTVKVHRIIDPILSEYHTKSDYIVSASPPLDLPTEISGALTVLSLELRQFVIGMEHRLTIDIEVSAILNAVRILRSESRSVNARTNLSYLEAIFASYEPQEVDGLRFVSSAPEKLLDAFDNLINDSSYLKASSYYYELGLC